ncbi:hypothetical protein ACFPRL_10980 [Pseudoclavibacter helvolus]
MQTRARPDSASSSAESQSLPKAFGRTATMEPSDICSDTGRSPLSASAMSRSRTVSLPTRSRSSSMARLPASASSPPCSSLARSSNRSSHRTSPAYVPSSQGPELSTGEFKPRELWRSRGFMTPGGSGGIA